MHPRWRFRRLSTRPIWKSPTGGPVHWHADYKKIDSGHSSDEVAQSVTNWEQRRAVEQSLELRLKDINETLGRINDDDFGSCNKCKQTIDEKRLSAVPMAAMCMNCTQESEPQNA